MTRPFIFCCIVPLLLAADVATRPHQHARSEIPPGVTSLDLCASDARVHVLTALREPEKPAQLFYQRFDGKTESFTDPVQLGQDQPPTIAKRGMDAQIAAYGDHLIAAWPCAGTDKMGRGPMATAISSDGGQTWRAGPNPADDGLTIGHSFIDLAADAAGNFHLVWIDGREGDYKGLRYAKSTDGGATWSANQTLNPSICECCWNAVTVAADGELAVLYRRRDPRDMALVRSRDTGTTWTAPVTVGAFGWNIDGCPHVGGAIQLRDHNAYALVWTARDTNTHGVYFLASSDTAATWSTPMRIGPSEATHPDLTIDATGTIIAAWDAYRSGQGIYTAQSTDGGNTWTAPQRLTAPEVSATHPRLLVTPTGVRAFWSQRLPGKPSTLAGSAVHK